MRPLLIGGKSVTNQNTQKHVFMYWIYTMLWYHNTPHHTTSQPPHPTPRHVTPHHTILLALSPWWHQETAYLILILQSPGLILIHWKLTNILILNLEVLLSYPNLFDVRILQNIRWCTRQHNIGIPSRSRFADNVMISIGLVTVHQSNIAYYGMI